MSTLTGGQAVYQALKAMGVKHVFCIVSIHNMPIIDAIRRGGDIELIMVRHEQGGAHAADGYSRATGEIGVMIASTGPGTTNTLTGLYESAYASSRVLLITGQAETRFYGKGKGYVHELENQLPLLDLVTQRAESPRFASDIVPAIYRTVEAMSAGRPQPGAVEIPINLQYETIEGALPEPPESVSVAPDPAAVKQAAEILSKAKRRLILAGGGVNASDASEALVKLAEALDAPVVTTSNGRGSIPEDHPLSLGTVLLTGELQQIVAETDIMLAVGTRFQGGPNGGNWQLKMPPMIHLDIDPRMIHLNYPADAEVVGDARLGLEGILEALNPVEVDATYNARVKETSKEAKTGMLARIGPDHESVMNSIRDSLPRDGLIVRDSTVPAYFWGNNLIPLYEPRTTMGPTSGAIGPGLPLAIGAALGSGKKTVVIQGDGGFMLHIGELATAAQYNLPIIICLFNDKGYGVLRALQTAQFGESERSAVDLHAPDFVAVAKGMGLASELVDKSADFPAAFSRALDTDGPVLLEINLDNFSPIQWRAVTR
ncbi:MAG: thiamine pyrophosphate-binding protein [Pseudomonadota bacterium]